MTYDHAECAADRHDRTPADATGTDDDQPADADGLIVCRDCGAALMYCETFDDYDHADPATPPCFLIGA
ncbi:hypothetical protein SAMN05421837_107314 [Amycolatopsis pretoriensis]|uniref:Uncharacterized protein n=1 Tax=Amycolatopsis pretoriensis TaxID=218821 RepID=A0A1H5RA73_9PSEU|nr:hypothetical protein [Amycolatopsis pretoriensis]SEF34307.1 hypothetical protein SAMN05421837_107314 [Amycolatopsis pretoriensis]